MEQGAFPKSLLKGARSMGGFRLGHTEREIGRILRRSNPTFAGVQDAIDQPIYDSMSVAQAAAFPSTTLFQAQVGAGGKTYAQTNMEQAGTLQTPQRLLLKGIYLVIVGNTTPTDMITIQNNVSFTLKVGTKDYLKCNCGFLTAGGRGLVVDSVSNVGVVPVGSAPVYSTSNGHPQGMFALDNQWFIESGESFKVILYPETPFNMQANSTNPPGVGTTIYVYLDGTLYRQVQ